MVVAGTKAAAGLTSGEAKRRGEREGDRRRPDPVADSPAHRTATNAPINAHTSPQPRPRPRRPHTLIHPLHATSPADMLGRSKRQRQGDATGAAHDADQQQPLLNGSDEDLHAPHTHPPSDDVIFNMPDEDDADYAEASALDAPEDTNADAHTPRTGHSVRFREDVQVIGPPLRSMQESRETGASASARLMFGLCS